MKKIFKKILNGFKKIISVIKKKWLVKTTTTVLLMAIFIAIFILITTGMKSLNLNPIDITSEGVNSLTQETKNKLKDIDKEINIYLINYTENDSAYKLVMQYQNVNKNIKVELVDISARTDLAQKYSVTTSDGGIIVVESNDKFKKITSNDLYTYDYSSYDTIDLTEEKVTSTIVNLTATKVSNVYIVDNYCQEYLTKDTYMSGLSNYMDKEALSVKDLDTLVSGKVPDDCDLLLIVSPLKDFEAQTADEIINYINNGGNVLWIQGAYGKELSLPNVQRVLDVYGIKSFTPGYVIETNSKNTLSGYLDALVLDIPSNDITGTENLKSVFLDCTKINVSDDETLKNLNVTKTDIISTNETALYRSDFTSSSSSKIESDEQGSFTLGALFEKKIGTDEKSKTSKLVMYSNDYFASSIPYSQMYNDGWIDLYNNKDVALNTALYLTDSDVSLTIRKNTNTKTFTMTNQEYSIILAIVFVVPILIIIGGITVWQVRRRKK